MAESEVTPIFVTVKDAAAILGGTSPWTVNRLCQTGAIDSKWRGKRRLVVLASLREYAASLPDSKPDEDVPA